MTRIEKKIWPEHFEAILRGDKTFEIRLNDFSCEKGDILILKEWHPEEKRYTGREIEKEVTHVTKLDPQNDRHYSHEDVSEHGYQIIGFHHS